jgi:hypothetical protein
MLPGDLHGAVPGRVVEHQDLGLEVHGGALTRDRVEAVAEESALLGVDDTEGQFDGQGGLHLAVREPGWRVAARMFAR